jgi:hypothetical protein
MLKEARALLTGLGAGAGWMYFFDPQTGGRRRALLRDRCTATINDAACWVDKALRDAGHRAQGAIAEIEGMLDLSVPSDQQLVERVRACLGHFASHPRLIEVHAEEGHITLTGGAPADEIHRICASAAQVRGVRSVGNQLDTQSGPDVTNDGHHRRRVQPTLDVMRENWAPSTRLVTGSIGCALMLNCLARRTPGAVLMGTLGFGLFMRAVSNRDMMHLIEEGTEAARPIAKRVQGMSRGLHAGQT